MLQRCRQVWGDRGDVITTAINATDPATALEHNLYVRHPNSLNRGQVGRVTIVGDAAHPVRPTGMYFVTVAVQCCACCSCCCWLQVQLEMLLNLFAQKLCVSLMLLFNAVHVAVAVVCCQDEADVTPCPAVVC